MIGALALELARSAAAICSSRSSISSQADVDVARATGRGSAGDRAARGRRDRTDRETGHGCPKAISVAWMRFFSVVRCRTRCSRKRASSRSRRIDGSGSQIAGTRSRADSSASTRASILSVLHASGASPLTFGRVGDQHLPAVLLEACRARTARRSSTRSPPRTGPPCIAARPRGRAARRRPAARPHSSTNSPAADSRQTSTLRRLRSNPACNMKTGLLGLAPR